jgi:hypothetical protein
MSAFALVATLNVRYGSLADITVRSRHVRFTPIADIRQCRWDVRKVPLADVARSIEFARFVPQADVFQPATHPRGWPSSLKSFSVCLVFHDRVEAARAGQKGVLSEPAN